MSDFRLERVGPERWPEVGSIWSWVYGQSPPSEEPPEPREGEVFYLGTVSGEPAMACRVETYPIAIGDRTLSCGGVGAVGTLAEQRQSGAASNGMEALLHEMRREGHAVACLYAFRESFYRSFGYESCGWRWLLKAPVHRLPKVPCELPVVRIDPDEIGRLDDCYNAFIRARSGSSVRDARLWRHRLGKKPPMVFAIGDPIEAYCWGTMESFWGELSIGECAWSSGRGYESLLGFIRGWASNQTTVSWCEPPDSPFLAGYLDQGVSADVHRPSMFRVLDVAAVLAGIRTEATGSITLAVEDDLVPENAGPWTMECGPDGSQVSRGGEPDLLLDIRALTQIVLGQPSVNDLIRHEKVTIHKLENLALLNEAFSPRPVVCMEFF